MVEIPKDLIWTPSADFMAQEVKFIEQQLKEIGAAKIEEMVKVANKYRDNAYTPYSGYKVGASILCTDGDIFGGCNSEGVNYSTTNHAEGTAIATANAAGKAVGERKYMKALVVVHEGDSGPCGECLQRMVEHCDNCLIIVAGPDGQIKKITTLKAIFPYNFNPSHLGK